MLAHDLLRTWFVTTKTRVTAFATDCEVSRQTVHSWLNGTTPSTKHLMVISKLTGGAVPVDSWFVEKSA